MDSTAEVSKVFQELEFGQILFLFHLTEITCVKLMSEKVKQLGKEIKHGNVKDSALKSPSLRKLSLLHVNRVITM